MIQSCTPEGLPSVTVRLQVAQFPSFRSQSVLQDFGVSFASHAVPRTSVTVCVAGLLGELHMVPDGPGRSRAATMSSQEDVSRRKGTFCSQLAVLCAPSMVSSACSMQQSTHSQSRAVEGGRCRAMPDTSRRAAWASGHSNYCNPLQWRPATAGPLCSQRPAKGLAPLSKGRLQTLDPKPYT